jgi:hypothetical protein
MRTTPTRCPARWRRRGIEESFAKQKDDIAPYTMLGPVVEAVKQVVGARLALFSGAAA